MKKNNLVYIGAAALLLIYLFKKSNKPKVLTSSETRLLNSSDGRAVITPEEQVTLAPAEKEREQYQIKYIAGKTFTI